MSNLFAINGATARQQGSGLIVYDKLAHIFSKSNNAFNSTIGLWRVPPDRAPTFQITTSQNVLNSFVYKETSGNNNFTGATYTPSAGVFTMVWSGLINGVQKYIWQTNDDNIYTTLPPFGRWIIEIVMTDGIEEYNYYTEEFLTTDCCDG